jgi:hypothetical protein
MPRDDFKELLDEANNLKQSVSTFLSAWPRDDSGSPLFWRDTSHQHRDNARKLALRTRRWFNLVNSIVVPLILHDRTFLYTKLRQVEAAIYKHQYRKPLVSFQAETVPPVPVVTRQYDVDVETRLETAERDAAEGMDSVIDIIKAAPPLARQISSVLGYGPTELPPSSFQPNTAFILMWMDKTQPELKDVLRTVKRVCKQFGITAFRADEFEQADVITTLILDYIRSAEFLIADLTGERPNVYYEVGYAHAIGKRPILFRHVGVHLHFDLSVHNVPEYQTFSDLEELLTRRLEAITGKKPLL